jgi:hypothetical protein
MAFALAALLVPAMPQPPSYHQFADDRPLLGIPNFWNVISNLPFLVGGLWGLISIHPGAGPFQDLSERTAYRVFFAGAALTCLGSAWYHLAPDNTRLVWDRLPMTLGFAGLVCAAVGERIDPTLGRRALWPLVGLGLLSVLYWHASERAGAGNLVPYAAFQAWSVAAILFIVVACPPRHHSHGHLLVWAVAWYALAKVFELFDPAVYGLLGGTLSGHTIKHLLAAAAVFAIVRQLRLRAPMQVASMPPA